MKTNRHDEGVGALGQRGEVRQRHVGAVRVGEVGVVGHRARRPPGLVGGRGRAALLRAPPRWPLREGVVVRAAGAGGAALAPLWIGQEGLRPALCAIIERRRVRVVDLAHARDGVALALEEPEHRGPIGPDVAEAVRERVRLRRRRAPPAEEGVARWPAHGLLRVGALEDQALLRQRCDVGRAGRQRCGDTVRLELRAQVVHDEVEQVQLGRSGGGGRRQGREQQQAQRGSRRPRRHLGAALGAEARRGRSDVALLFSAPPAAAQLSRACSTQSNTAHKAS